ncbi:hypothetical protein C8Q75DRAFT_777177 [Abortiporus biennis]|nr:hypothetical protein C8Q75DRAFT_777177 [Abortiporus biennis]
MPKVRSSGRSQATTDSGRRRLLPEQLEALQALYDETSHPTKEERAALAAELGMELKSVNVWYQNKRRSMKRQAAAWKPENDTASVISSTSTSSIITSRSVLGRNSSFSLDCIASARERKDKTQIRPPLTPKRNRQSRPCSHSPDPNHLWEYLPSSPTTAPPSSPSRESTLLSALPPNSKTMRSLEWACAKERASRKYKILEDDDDFFGPASMEIREVESMLFDQGEDTEIEQDEAITPENSMEIWANVITPLRPGYIGDRTLGTPSHPDVQAAITLLDFKEH